MKTVVTSKPTEGRHWTGTGANGSYTIYKLMADMNVDGEQLNGQLTTTKKDVFEKVLNGEMREFEVEKIVSKDGKYTDYKIKSPAAAGARSFGGKYEPRQKMSWSRYEKFVGACYGLANQLDSKNAAALFDKILGCASIMVEIPAEKIETPPANKITMATEKDIVKSDELKDELTF
jgi:hypothetical protein